MNVIQLKKMWKKEKATKYYLKLEFTLTDYIRYTYIVFQFENLLFFFEKQFTCIQLVVYV